MNEILDEQVTIFSPETGRQAACKAFGVNARSWRHRQQVQASGVPLRARDARPKEARKPHPAELTAAEREAILAELCSQRFCDLPPAQMYNKLLDEGVYLCSVRQMYRLLEDHGLSQDRRKGGHSRQGQHAVPVLEAAAPNVCWTWDITALKGPVRGVKYFLYTVLDIFSRYVVGWTISTRETAATATKLIRRCSLEQGVKADQLTLHSDRGSPMIAGSMTELLRELGVKKSHSRPRVSNDNPFSESNFKTLKYHADYPENFHNLADARQWCEKFYYWYNHEHYHSSIAYLHPADLHYGNASAVIEARQATLDAAHAAFPQRFARRPQPPAAPTESSINKGAQTK